jgi:hypothetical protein
MPRVEPTAMGKDEQHRSRPEGSTVPVLGLVGWIIALPVIVVIVLIVLIVKAIL